MLSIINKYKTIIIHYIELIKPGIILGNITSILGGFFLASQEKVHFYLLFTTIIGTSLIIAANCVLNNIIDHNIDAYMQRTNHRVLVKKLLTLQHATIYAIILFFSGFYILLRINNLQIIYLTIISSIIYIVVYSLLMKKKSIYSTLIGSIAGSTPPAIGYCTVTNKFDMCALILIILFILWQMPHFYSIAIFRQEDYTNALIPTFPLKKGIKKTKTHIICYITLFMISLTSLSFYHYTSYAFLLIMEIISSGWLYVVIFRNKNINNNNNHLTYWAKKIFISSILILISFNIAISIDSLYHKCNVI